jgi:Putative esterase
MGGFGALDLGRLAPTRFCAIGAHSAALWFRGADTPAGAFDDAQDFARNDLIRFARERELYHVPVWIDVGQTDPFFQADTTLAKEQTSQRSVSSSASALCRNRSASRGRRVSGSVRSRKDASRRASASSMETAASTRPIPQTLNLTCPGALR